MNSHFLFFILLISFHDQFIDGTTEPKCCCIHYNRQSIGYYMCQTMSNLKCQPIEEEKFDRYVNIRIHIINCTVDFAKVNTIYNIRHLEANHSRLINVHKVWENRSIMSVKFAQNDLTEMLNFSGMRFSNTIDLSHNRIELVNETRWFSASTVRIYLQNNRIRFVHELSFSYLYDLLELNLANNLLKEFGVVLDLTKAIGSLISVDLCGNMELNRIKSIF